MNCKVTNIRMHSHWLTLSLKPCDDMYDIDRLEGNYDFLNLGKSSMIIAVKAMIVTDDTVVPLYCL